MSRAQYPFAALAGQEPMKLALLLAAVDWRLGVLLRGDKGAGKTTAARALAALLPAPARFVNLPVGATEDRLLGGMDLERALKGEPALKPGLLAEAHGGVLYVDEVNLLPSHLGDALLDAAASGLHVVEREGFSASYPAEFVLLGSMNPEEGSLRPQLLDRFALSVDVTAPLEPAERHAIVERRLSFERDPAAFCNVWAEDQRRLVERIASARTAVANVVYASVRLRAISEQVADRGVRSLRADLAALRAALAYAALAGETEVSEEHVATVLPLVLAHRKPQTPRSPRQAPPPPPPPPQQKQDGTESASSPEEPQQEPAKTGMERIFQVMALNADRLERLHAESPVQGASATAATAAPGPVVGSRRMQESGELDLRASLMQSVLERGEASLAVTTLRERVRSPRSGTRYLLVIDSSGSHAAQQRMRLVKGAALGLLRASFQREDEVAIIAFRGTSAEVLLEPSHDLSDAERVLEYLPTGGRTPLAHALACAHEHATPQTLLLLFTDGRPNVALHGGDPGDEAMALAATFRCDSLVIDTADEAARTGLTQRLAGALRGRCATLAELTAGSLTAGVEPIPVRL